MKNYIEYHSVVRDGKEIELACEMESYLGIADLVDWIPGIALTQAERDAIEKEANQSCTK